MPNALDVLIERGFVYQVSDEAGLRAALEQPLTLYSGFDPTASSLTVGHLVPIMAMANLQRYGHRPIALVGGGTAMVGDPTGKTAARPLLAREEIDANAARFKHQLSRFLDFGDGRALLLDNAEWLLPLRYIEFLRDYGRHLVVNQMLRAETYATRLESGLTFLEFNYMPLQAYDFLHLYRHHSCRLQIGGSDQWANSLAGADLIRRVEGRGDAFVLSGPLLTTASGAKMGKTEGGAVWLDPALFAPYDYYQYWINTEDPDVERYLALFTFLPMDQVRELGRLQGAELRRAKEVLAFEATRLAHGEEAARQAQAASRVLFGRAAPEGLAETELVPTTEIAAAEVERGLPAWELLTRTGLVRSKAEGRRLIEQGGAYLYDQRLPAADHRITNADLRDGVLLLRAGKKRYHRVVVR